MKLKVTGESLIENIRDRNKFAYVSPTVHVSNKLTIEPSTATETIDNNRNKMILFSHRSPHVGRLDRN